MLPSKLKNFHLFSDGFSWVGQTGEIALPKVVEKTEQWRGGGMLGEVPISLGVEAMEMETKIGGLAIPLLRRFGMVGAAGSMLRFNGAYQDDQIGIVTAAELIVRGKHTEIDPGTAKAGTDTEWTIKSMLSYLKWSFNGRVELEVDLLNNIFVVGGEDRMAAIRAALLI